MKPIFVRPHRADDAETHWNWAVKNPVNGFDPGVVGYPTSFVLCAYDETGPLAYMPVQQPLMMESLAPRPGLSKLQTAAVLKAITQAVVTQSYVKGAGEIYFLGTDPPTDEFATGRIFEELPYKVYRVKIKTLEGKPNADHD